MSAWWQVLGLSPQASKAEIKRAYAAKIKQYRPETHPEEFKQVHSAYKQALSGVEPPPMNEPFIDIELPLAEPKPIKKKAHKPSTNNTHNEREALWYDLNEQIDHVADNRRSYQKVKNWQFLADERDNIIKYDLIQAITLHTFARVLDIRPNIDILIFLDEVLDWRGQRLMLEEHFNENDVDQVLIELDIIEHGADKTSATPQLGGIWVLRFSALCIDLVGFCLWLYITFQLLTLVRPESAALLLGDAGNALFLVIPYGVAAKFLLSPFFEASPLRASPGMFVVSLKVLSSRHKKLNIFHAYYRQLCLALSLICIKFYPFFYLILGQPDALPHDIISRTRLVPERGYYY